MRLLMITRKVDKDDGLAGFSYNWIRKLASKVDFLYVMCLEKGNVSGLPDNVEVYSLGKENGKNRFKEFINFQKLAIKLLPKVDGVFSHQNPEYGILIAPWAKIFRKKLIAWYVHKQVGTKLKTLNFLADKMISINKESFRLPSKKIIFLHHGIDTEIFSYKEKSNHDDLRLLSVSRISATKQIDKMIDLVAELKNNLDKKVVLKIVGEASLEKDKFYLNELKDQAIKLGVIDNIDFAGSVANDKTPALYQWADIFFNFSKTGSVDKTVLEAMSCGTLVLVSNEAFNFLASAFFIGADERYVDKILPLTKLDLSEQNTSGKNLRQIVINEHNLDDLIVKIIKLY